MRLPEGFSRAAAAVGSIPSRVGAGVATVRRRPGSFASTGFVALAAIGLLVAVFLSDGFRARTYDLEDSYVWVTDPTDVLRYNVQTDELDWKAPPGDGDGGPEVIQDGTDVFVSKAGVWNRVDVAEESFEEISGLGGEAQAEVGGGTFAVLDRDGGVWVIPVDRAAELALEGAAPSDDEDADPEGEGSSDGEGSGGEEPDAGGDSKALEAALDAGDGAVFAVGRTGEVVVLTADRSQLVVLSGDEDREPRTIKITGDVQAADALEVTLVGTRPAALVGNTLVLPDGSVQEIEAETTRLQLPGDVADEVLVATESDLLAVPLGGGKPEVVTEDVDFGVAGDDSEAGDTKADVGASTPKRPVAVGGQRAAVWTGGGARVFWRAGDTELAEMQPGFGEDELRFRVNRNNVVLNNVSTGDVYALIDGKLRNSKWQDAQPDEQEPEDDPEAEEENPISFEPTENRPPKAHDDKYGARPGLPTIMHPLDNDEDPDSDVLTIELDEASVRASGATVELVEGAQGLQVTPPNDGDTLQFTYRAYDGNPRRDEGVSNWATVTVTVFGAEVNNAPELKKDRNPHLDVGAKSSADYQVLQDYVDPEGDPVYLAGAAPEDPSRGAVAARSNGKLTYTDLAGEAGETFASVDVADAPMIANVTSKKTEGARLPVAVTAGDLAPLARNDYVTTLVDTAVVVQPLANDEDPNGDTLSFELAGLEHLDTETTTVTKNADNTVTVVSSSPGPVNFGYELTAGSKTVKARIRVDVVDAEVRVAPTAGLDLVVLPRPTEGQPAERTVDLLVNDYSPQGDVLVATGLSGLDESNPGASTLTAQLLELRRLRVTSDAPSTTPVRFTYTLSDGVNEVDGTVVVVASGSDQDLPPITTDDVVTVRSGDIVSVPVLANDLDPEGARLYLGPEVKALDDNSGTAWAAGSRVRFVAPEVPLRQTATIDIQYMAYDGPGPDFSAANGSPGRLRVRVTNPGGDSNSAPRPLPVEARVLAGKQVKITIPTAGIDPDGDSVVLVGIGFRNGEPDAPRKGRIVGDPGVDSFVYEAFEDQAGTDSFSYKVIDSAGAVAFGKVRVGVAKGSRNQPPVAVRDRYEVAPGAPLVVDPLANDIDSDGDPIDFVEDDPFIGYEGELAPKVEKLANGANGVRFKVPDTDGQGDTVWYRITDPVGATSDSTIELFVSSAAVGHPPIARDDRAKVEDPLLTSVQVPVLDNDSDPDGDVADLELSVIGSNATVVDIPDDEGLDRLDVTLADHPQIVVYKITDPQGLSGHAVVRIPAAGEEVNLPPLWKPAGPCAKDVKMPSGRTEKGISFDGADGPQDIDLKGCGFTDPEGNDVRFVADGSIGPGVTGKLTSAVKDATTFTLADSQGGTTPYQDVVTLVATDAPQGKEGEQILVQIPVGVTATNPEVAINQPPKWKQTTSIEVTQDGEPSLPVDLRQLVDDPEDDELTFDVNVPRGITVEGDVTKGTLRLKGNKDLALGDGSATVEVTVTDGQEGDDRPVAADFAVSGIKTNKAMPTLRPVASVDDATKGEQSTVNVLEGSTDPLGKGLKVLRADAGSNPGTVAFTADGSVSFTPAKVGPATVSFVVSDDLDREVAGKVTYKVAAPPGPPTTPQVLDFTYNSVSLRWGQAEDNASPIQKYEIKASPGGKTASCGTELACTVEGLTPGTAYTFIVTATNDKGEGTPSPASAPATPDECPKAPTNVNLEFDADKNTAAGGQLVATWRAPQNNGTAIAGYEIAVDPGGQILTPGAAASEQVITGLTNGTDHNITIRAKNQCEGEWGDEALAGPAIPAGVPDAPANVAAAVISDPVGGRVRLDWRPPTASGSPNNKGDDVAAYTIKEIAGKRQPQTIQASQVTLNGSKASLELSVDRKAADLRFTVEATNKAGTGSASAASPPVSAPSAPSPPTITSVKASDNGTDGLDRKARLAWSPPADSGGAATITQYQYVVDGQGNWQALPVDGLIQKLTNGTDYRFQVRAYNGRYWSEPSAPSPVVRPYGPLAAASVSGSVPANQPYANFSWSTPSGNGRNIRSVRVTVNGAVASTAATGSTSTPSAWSTTFRVEVRAEDEAGQVATAARNFTTGPPPPPPWSQKFAGRHGTATHSDTHAAGRVNVPAWTGATVHCWADVPGGVGSSIGPRWYLVTMDGGQHGYASSDTFWDAGDPPPGTPVDLYSQEYDPRVPHC